MIFTGALKKSLNARGLCVSIKKASECAALLLAGNRSGRRVAFRETPPKCAEFRRRSGTALGRGSSGEGPKIRAATKD